MVATLAKALTLFILASPSLPFVLQTPVSFTAASYKHEKTKISPSQHSMLPPSDSLELLSSIDIGNSQLLSEVTSDEINELTKSVVIILAFGGGLIPALFSANSAMMKTLSGKRASDENYVASSGASGPNLPFASLLLAPAPIPLSDIIAVIGRIQNVDSIADWRNLPTAKLPGVSKTNPPMWLPRETFKENIRRAKFTGWPVDSKGEPIGGEELKKLEGPRVSKSNAVIGDAALDVVFDTWAWGASVATPDKVDAQLRDWRKSNEDFDLGGFVGAAVRGRGNTVLASLTFVVIQIVVFGTLFIAPFFRQFLNIDIGFGQLGECDGVCTTLSDLF